MRAELILNERIQLDEVRFVQTVIRRVPEPVPPSAHGYKYRLAYVVNEVCALRYDNERDKGDHKHVDGVEVPYAFTTLDQLVEDFWADVNQWGD